jgi:hypothetical protein
LLFHGSLFVTTTQIFNLLAVVYEGSADSGQGLPSLSKWAAKQHATWETQKRVNDNQMKTLKAGLNMMQIQAELKQKMANATTDAEKDAIAVEMEGKASEILLRILWTTIVVDITCKFRCARGRTKEWALTASFLCFNTATIHETTQMIFFDQSVEKEERKFRAAAVNSLGQIWMKCPAPESNPSEEERGARRLYEEAAFAAMVETVKRKDDAAYGTSQ